MFKKIKAGAEEAAMNAQIEAMYLQGKKSGFHHPPEVEAQIQVMRETREEIPLLREDISAKLNLEKDLASTETKTGGDFTNMSEHGSMHPELKTIFQLVAALNTTMASHRYNYHATVEQIKEEWKGMETVDLKDVRVKQDQVNRTLITKKFFEKEKKSAKATENESKYRSFVAELVHLVHALREKKEELLPGYILNIVQAEMEFHRKTLEELVKCENTIRSMGKINPVKFTAYEQFGPVPSYGGDEGESPRPTQTFSTPAPPLPVVARPSTNVVRAKGLYPFNGQSKDELTFQPGDILTIHERNGDWWTAELNGKTGLIPGNYVQLL